MAVFEEGRDYFDLIWYLEKVVKPNLRCIPEAHDLLDLKNQLLAAVERVDSQSIRLDLEALIDNQQFVDKLSSNLKDILKRGLEEW